MSHAAWMQQAENDLAAAKILSDANHHSQAVWLAGQAVEKAHKAILAALGLRYQDKHYRHLGHDTGEISNLLPTTLHEPTDPQVAVRLSTLEGRVRESRYPIPRQTGQPLLTVIVPPVSSFTTSQQDVADAEQLLRWCQDRVARALRAERAMKPRNPPTKKRGAR
ncbi:MAG: HEPN domain-containing protein [Deltaproteobacteria bacterium]|nr:HEPN domain-containing protein [Deltaproteobacteria bacterium]